MSEQLRKVIDNNGLKVKLYITDCGKHPTNAKMEAFVKNPKYDTADLSHDVEQSKFSPYDVVMIYASQLYEELGKDLFIGYSCLLIVINALCNCRSEILKKIFDVLRKNKSLRYKSKLVMSMYMSKSDLRNGKNNDSVATAFFMKHVSQLPKRSHFLHPTESEVRKRSRPAGMYFGMIVKDTLKSLKDSKAFMAFEPENTIFLQSFIHRAYDIGIEVESVLHQTYNSPLTAMQLVLRRSTEVVNDFRLIQTSERSAFYFFSINPALSIIINQKHFSSDQSSREGSDQDVLRLVRELKVAKIPYILIQDCNKQELLSIFKYLSEKNFYPLEKLLLFVMSHGDSNGNIHTTDDKVHIRNDLVSAIQKNESLKTCTNFMSLVNCRGKMDANHADLDDFDDIRPSDSSSLKDNSLLLFSVPDQFKSPRSPQHGTPLVSTFCKHFRTIYHNDSIKTLVNSIDNTLKKTKYYEKFPNMATELVCKDASANTNILPIPIVATNMIKLIQTIVNDTEKMFENSQGNQTASGSNTKSTLRTTFHITGNIYKTTIETDPLIKNYFAKELDDNYCQLVGNFECVSTKDLSEHINKEFF